MFSLSCQLLSSMDLGHQKYSCLLFDKALLAATPVYRLKWIAHLWASSNFHWLFLSLKTWFI